jgi:peptidoglycan/xylan/chitin deacetylase (PgdA/CDA1 family)
MTSRSRKIPFIFFLALIAAGALLSSARNASEAVADESQKKAVVAESSASAAKKPPRNKDLLGASAMQKGRSLVLIVDTKRVVNLSRLDRLPAGKLNASRYLCFRLTPGPGSGIRRLCFGGALREGKLGLTVANASGRALRSSEVQAQLKRPRPTRIVATLPVDSVGLKTGSYDWRLIGRLCEERGCAESIPVDGSWNRIEIKAVKPVGCTTGAAGLVTSGPRNSKVVALTFDDGPSSYTSGFLRVLREKNVRATFFVLGQLVATYPDLARQIVREGHEIASHSWKHDLYPSAADLRQTSATIKSVTGFKPCSFRPPGGARNASVIAGAGQSGMKTIIWDVDPFDWRLPGTAAIRNIVLRGVRPGSIVLSHDGGGPRSQTLEALPGIIDGLRARGYKFVTVTEILGGKFRYKIA